MRIFKITSKVSALDIMAANLDSSNLFVVSAKEVRVYEKSKLTERKNDIKIIEVMDGTIVTSLYPKLMKGDSSCNYYTLQDEILHGIQITVLQYIEY